MGPSCSVEDIQIHNCTLLDKNNKQTFASAFWFECWCVAVKINEPWLYSASFGLQLSCHTFPSFALYWTGVSACECGGGGGLCSLSSCVWSGLCCDQWGFSVHRVLLRVRMLYYLKQEVIGSQAQKVLDGVDSRWAQLWPVKRLAENLNNFWETKIILQHLLPDTFQTKLF